jgi:hypothetical protein
MAKYVRILLALVLLGIAAFCGFGLLATFEPTDQNVIAFRIGYGAIGIASILGAVWLVWPKR